jgi:hypothetical protein
MNLRIIEKQIIDGGDLTQAMKDWLLLKASDYWHNHPEVSRNFPIWKKCLAWVAGYQSLQSTKYKKAVLSGKPTKPKLVFNRMKTFVRTVLSKMTADVHQMGVVPKTDEGADMEAAGLGDRISLAIHDKLKFKQIINSLKLWLIVLNRGYLRVFWNEDDYGILGYRNKEAVDEDGYALLDDQDQPILTEEIEEVREDGDIGCEAVSPFACRHDPLSVDRKKWRWFIYGEDVDAEELEERFGLPEGSLKESDKSNRLEVFDLEISQEGDVTVGSPEKKEDVVGRTVHYKRFWTPHIYVFMAGNRVLKWGINKMKQIPYFRFEEMLVPMRNAEIGLDYNPSMVRDAMPTQKEWNRQRTAISRALRQSSKMKIMLPLNALISRKMFNNEMGTFLDVNTALGKPEQLKMDPLPSFTQVYMQDLEREFEDKFAARDASLGRLPKRASHASGTLLSLLLEQDEAILNPMLSMINDELSEVWSLILRLVADNYVGSRLLKYVGSDGKTAVESFRGADLQGNTDVQVTSQTGLPKSRVMRTEMIVMLQKGGYFTHKQALEMMQFGQAEKIFSDVLQHDRKESQYFS